MNINTALYLSTAGQFDMFAGEGILRQGRNWLKIRRLKTQIRNERRELEQLPEHLLQDIGVDKADAMREAQRGFHDLPVGRRSH